MISLNIATRMRPGKVDRGFENVRRSTTGKVERVFDRWEVEYWNVVSGKVHTTLAVMLPRTLLDPMKFDGMFFDLLYYDRRTFKAVYANLRYSASTVNDMPAPVEDPDDDYLLEMRRGRSAN